MYTLQESTKIQAADALQALLLEVITLLFEIPATGDC